jgi:NAD(P)-dependent dehydrogenase (short-subunit alcohol dehydrogenase family)
MIKEFTLEGKVALITGGGRGIGRAICLVLAEAGSDVAVVARTQREIEETANSIRNYNRRTIAIPCDVTKSKEVNSMVEEVISKLGKIDILVNVAGAGDRKPLVPLPGFKPKWAEKEPAVDFYSPISDEEWKYMIDVNLTSIFLCARAVGPYMIKQRKGKIINITSFAGMKAYPYHILYTSSKAAANMFTRSLALEWARYNINVNAIGPGVVRTALTERAFEDEAIKEKTLRSIPLGRFCEDREVGLLVFYLASSASDYITGQTIYIDGGVSA